MFDIIIPIYNSEQYVEKCIESLENQTFKDFNIIAINDHSTDNTFNIVKKLAEKYKNIKLYEPVEKLFNGGSRNIGIKKSKSKYILFIDNDDWYQVMNLTAGLFVLIVMASLLVKKLISRKAEKEEDDE